MYSNRLSIPPTSRRSSSSQSPWRSTAVWPNRSDWITQWNIRRPRTRTSPPSISTFRHNSVPSIRSFSSCTLPTIMSRYVLIYDVNILLYEWVSVLCSLSIMGQGGYPTEQDVSPGCFAHSQICFFSKYEKLLKNEIENIKLIIYWSICRVYITVCRECIRVRFFLIEQL